MQGVLNSSPRLPGRYVINRHVISPLTCRHKYHCACHGEPPKPDKSSKKAEEAAKAEMERKLFEIMGILGFALKQFPDARDAVNNALREYELRHPS